MELIINKPYFNHTVQKEILYSNDQNIAKGIVSVDPIVIGYFNEDPSVNVLCSVDSYNLAINLEALGPNAYYDNSTGLYKVSEEPIDLKINALFKGSGRFPYEIKRNYAAESNLDLFKQHCDKDESLKFKYANELNYSFGLEFETCAGFIPNNKTFKTGLIPLRDGSIEGIEYASVILKGNHGLNLLKKQTEALAKYTDFDKNCSTHVHFSGFKISSRTLFRMYLTCLALETDLEKILPNYAFSSGLYKSTGKDYCKKLPNSIADFAEFYSFLSGYKTSYFGDLNQPHPKDVLRKGKWNIPARYYWVNFVNAAFYKKPKTVEFRVLAPTANFNKLLFWLYLYNAIIKFSELDQDKINKAFEGVELSKNSRLRSHVNRRMHSDVLSKYPWFTKLSLESIILLIYPKDLSKILLEQLIKVRNIEELRLSKGDRTGSVTQLDDKCFENFHEKFIDEKQED